MANEDKKTAAAESKPEKFSLVAVFGGPMRNDLTGDIFTGEPSKPVVIDAWLKVQMDAGKIEKAPE